MIIDPHQYRSTFLSEVEEHQACLEQSLLRLEQVPDDAESLSAAFRAAHSIKGGADAVGYPLVAQFTHKLESLLDQLRSRPANLSHRIELLLRANDALAGLIAACRLDGPPPAETDEIMAELIDAIEPARMTSTHALYLIEISPDAQALRNGIDPALLIRDLNRLGVVGQVRLPRFSPSDLNDPSFDLKDLVWRCQLTTTKPKEAILDVFEFCADAISLKVEAIDSSVPLQATVCESTQLNLGSTDFLEPMTFGTPSETTLNENVELIVGFCTEADEHLMVADRHLLNLESDPTRRDSLDAVYRGFHTIKGGASMLSLDAIRVLAHEAESLLNLARDGVLDLKSGCLDLAFSSVDTLKRQVDLVRNWISTRGKLSHDPDLPKLVEMIKSAASSASATGEKEAPVNSPPEQEITPTKAPPQQPETTPAPRPKPAAPKLFAVPPKATEPVVDGSQTPPKPLPPINELPAKEHPLGSPTANKSRVPTMDSRAPSSSQASGVTKVTEADTVRVDRSRLDKLINAIGELVIAQSMVKQEVEDYLRRLGGHSRALPELNKISRDLQELSLSLRMVPLQATFQKMTRLVRDLSKKIAKPVIFTTEGEETELDKTVVDQLSDPLLHMVRNALDHGLETKEERLAIGKPPEGRVNLRAYYQGGNVFIELSDDGRGMDREAILRKAVERELIQEGQRLADAEIYNLIFEPGFSTAKMVTDVSGRGVGMDVVRRNVEALHGNIHIKTQLGKGTTFTIRLPLTLAIMDGLTVGLGDDIYVLPLLSVIESFRPKASDVHVLAGQAEVIAVRGETVPLLRLSRLLGRPARFTMPSSGLVVLVEDQGKKFAILVDELLGQIQAVVKSLDVNFRRVDGLAGATVLGDGRVAMILDVHGLTRLAGRGSVSVQSFSEHSTTSANNFAEALAP